MNKIWIIAAALSLCGCASNSESAPEPTAVAVSNAVQPQVAATIAPPVVMATATPIAPMMENSAPAEPMASEPTASEQDDKREKVRLLRQDIGELERQKRALTQRKESLIAAGATSHPDTGPNYIENTKNRDDQIARKQKEIDDIMLSP